MTDREIEVLWNRRNFRVYWLTDDIAIGPQPAAGDWRAMKAAGVRAVLDLRREGRDGSREASAWGLDHLRLPVTEGEAPAPEQLRTAIEWIIERATRARPVLVHCREGRGRSAMVAVAALVRLGIPLPDAYQMLVRARPEASINTAQMLALEAFSGGVAPHAPSSSPLRQAQDAALRQAQDAALRQDQR